MFYLFVVALLLLLYFFLITKRAKKYKYDTSEDYFYNLESNLLAQTQLSNNTIELPQNFNEYDTLFLKIRLSRNLLSYFFKPSIKIEKTKHYFEYGARGIRYLNISHLKNQTLHLSLKNATLATSEISIYAYKNSIKLTQKTLILAPHADDAEIAAFGLYKRANDVTIITTTAGEHGNCNYCDLYKDKTQASLKKAELRAFDALTVGLLGNVPIENSLALGYFGGSLEWMHTHKYTLATSKIKGIDTMQSFRKVSHATIKLTQDVPAIYESFLNDLKEIIIQSKPDYIIAPHPAIDSHPDHKYTTFVLLEALKETQHICKLLLYTNHLKRSETYPIGAMHSSVSLPPNTQEFYFDSLYSFELDRELQIDKFFALESLHDLRDSLIFISLSKEFKHFKKMLKRVLSGKDKSYYKRAVRANELFFVVESENLEKLFDV
ncbi:MAG: PIG-L family deacetylase [Sulfurimonas sp.]|nr:PIG-L family deacetylase [Sulfurimonas sp.]